MSFNNTEKFLIVDDIRLEMSKYMSIQLDITYERIEASARLAQDIDIRNVIGVDNLKRAIDPKTDSDEELKQLLIPVLCFYTSSRALKVNQGYLSDSGYTSQSDSTDRNTAKQVGNDHFSIGTEYMQFVFEFLKKEDPNFFGDKSPRNSPRSIRIGGKERIGDRREFGRSW